MQERQPIGFLQPGSFKPAYDDKEMSELLQNQTQPLYIIRNQGKIGLIPSGTITASSSDESLDILGIIPSISSASLGSTAFKQQHNLKYALVAGAMANGICSEEIVIAMAKAGMLGFFGSGGLHPDRVEQAINTIQGALNQGESYGFNLLHNPYEPTIEDRTVDLYLRYGVNRVSAAAYLKLTKSIVRYRLHGLKEDASGNVIPRNHIFAKVSRSELAKLFMAPAPESIVKELLKEGKITETEATLSQRIPMAQDITAEADSGGHTDQRPLVSLVPTFLKLRDNAMEMYKYPIPLRVGAGGGISTPQSAAAALAMGADYIITGSVNQATHEAGTCESVKKTLCTIEPHDVTMAPAADMFEMGVKLQVMKFGTMFPVRSARLYQLYQQYNSIEEIPAPTRAQIEKQIFQKNLDTVWQETVSFFERRDPSQIEKAKRDNKHKMALIFRWYLGQSSLWAIKGVPERKMDYQVWTGPGMGAFNEWAKGTELESMEHRSVALISHNILRGAAIISRISILKNFGIDTPAGAANIRPILKIGDFS
jgi:PfaD family protein